MHLSKKIKIKIKINCLMAISLVFLNCFVINAHADIPLAVVQPYVATLALTCPGKGVIRFVKSGHNFFPSQPCALCKERGQIIRVSLSGGNVNHTGTEYLMSDAGTVCMHNIAFNENCFFPDDCFPFIAGRDYISIDLNQYINDVDLCRIGYY
jgi:hypothetical protein